MKKKSVFLLCSLCLCIVGVYYLVNNTSFFQKRENPLLDSNFYNNIDFSLIKDTDFKPAVDQAIDQARQNVQAIIDNNEEPSFLNTVVALDKSSALLDRVNHIFSHLFNCCSTPVLKENANDIFLKISEFENETIYNKKLFEKIKYVYDNQEKYNLDPVDKRLLEITYNSRIKEGIDLDETTQQEIRDINRKLVELQTQFEKNLDTQAREVEFVIEEKDKYKLEGVPNSSIESFKKEALDRKKEGYVLTYVNPEIFKVLQYSKDRSLRKQVLEMMVNRGKDLNSKLVVEIINLRLKKAKLLGFKNHAEYILKDNSMADTPDRVMRFIDELFPKAMKALQKEKKDILEFARKIEGDDKLEVKKWDFDYYDTKLLKQLYDYDPEKVKIYFELSNVRNSAFNAFTKLYGITFKKKENPSLYYKDDNDGIDVVEVFDKDGSYLGMLYLDYFARKGKRAGAWTTSIRKMEVKLDESGNVVEKLSPIKVVVFNFSSAKTEGKHLLYSLDVSVLFHELGHAINGFFIKNKYNSLLEIYRDFVELPSQIMENWAFDEEYLPSYAKHYSTQESIPDDLIKKIKALEKYGQGYLITSQLSQGLLDLNWHIIEEEYKGEEAQFEDTMFKNLGFSLEDDFLPRAYRFSHMITHGYDARYYSYMWSDMLVADAYSVFKEKGIFNKDIAESFRKNILSVANTCDPNEAYRGFRGKDPEISPLLKKLGFIQ